LSDPTHIANLLTAGLEHHRAGRYHEAELKYREVLAADARNADALHMLGLIGCKAGQYAQGVQFFQQAIGVRPGFADAWNNLGVALRTLQRTQEALTAFQQAVSSRPEFPEAHYNLAATLQVLGRLNEAASHFETCVQLKPGFMPAQQALATLQIAVGKIDSSSSAEALFGQAAALVQAGRISEGVETYRRGLAINPHADGAWNCLGNALQELGRLEEAVDAYEHVLALVPQSADALNNIGNALQRADKLEKAIEAYEQALIAQPHHLPAHGNLGVLYKDLGVLDKAGEHFKAALAIRPSSLARALLATLLPPVYSSLEDVAVWRTRLEENLEALKAEKPSFDLTRDSVPNLFYLAYQGGFDRKVQETLAKIYLAGNQGDLTPKLGSRPPGGKIRIGILSKQLRDHTIGTLMRGLFATLDRSMFHVTALPFFAGRDAVTDFIRSHSDSYVVVPDNVAAARHVILELDLDILFHADIGMDPLTYTLAFSRLAPVQCTTWGHPVTSGIPTIDYFISSELIEPPDGAEHYSETLIRLKSLPFYYYRPALPAKAKDRAAFGFEAGDHLYGCLQTLFKFHPEFDVALAGILRQDPLGTLVLLHAKHRQWEETLMARFQRTMPDVISRITWLPPQSREDFLSLMHACDVLLDTFHFSGGNTSYEALALGVPTVTLPGRYMKGRITDALYRKMGVSDCVASSVNEYVEIAVKLGTDQEWRQEVSRKILDVNGVLFENAAAVREMEEFFKRAVVELALSGAPK
jgi:predicted O-linked N-acetylglucosamine transferase (SPINDLY family)